MKKDIQQPKKQPEMIRKRILEQSIILASEKGTSHISIQNIANGVGISKGGVFHHFANKQILIEAMITEIIDHLDRKVESLIANDKIEYGKLTRAYINITFISEIDGLISPWSALAMTMITDHTFNAMFGKWFQDKLKYYTTTDHHPELALIRLATDGLWLQSITGIINSVSCLQYKNDLIQRTYLT
ncbi:MULTISPECIES: TetR/AcrR family transcriptional regulator [unclassified Acinetobacter]|uniref:TetR/AcrR family transcriptional regulator n=1 Tax=unclassified Acinetobacter TaxID=196816 RepID=UPI0029348731|nr:MULTISPECIES: TetR/AcrR family transcriptional regulator [unclassified Acinetobacter]WOE32007.1 TetR/AcrR family transcriptional regulator [Acinetobacter sp. SAAs470]WOE37475.1 TetR/AcrR family transcriptional regulator [Acinetobacter sp. SAAs474]